MWWNNISKIDKMWIATHYVLCEILNENSPCIVLIHHWQVAVRIKVSILSSFSPCHRPPCPFDWSFTVLWPRDHLPCLHVTHGCTWRSIQGEPAWGWFSLLNGSITMLLTSCSVRSFATSYILTYFCLLEVKLYHFESIFSPHTKAFSHIRNSL